MDALKLFAIFMVLWGHCVQYFLSGEPSHHVLYRIIYSFHMPLFMMVSGYFCASSLKQPFGAFVKKKFLQLILPCLVWGLALYVALKSLAVLTHSPVQASWSDLAIYLTFNLWFLKSCFLCYVLAWLALRPAKWGWLWVALSLLLVQAVPWFRLSVMYPCFLLGWVLRTRPRWQALVEEKWWIFALLFVLLLTGWNTAVYTNPISIAEIEPVPSAAFLWTGRQIYRLAIGCIGALFFTGLFRRHVPKQSDSKWLQNLCAMGSLTLGIYILQSIVLETILARVISLDTLSPWVAQIVVMPAVSVVVLLLCVVIIRWLSRSNRLAFFLFGKYKG